MKNKKGFTLVELLAVIVVLGIIMVIVTRSVISNVNESKKRVKFLAAKEITEMAAAYMEAETNETCVDVNELIRNGYLEEDVTNPETGKNGGINSLHKVCKNALSTCDEEEHDEYDVCSNEEDDVKFYIFDEYIYKYTPISE